MRKNRNYKVIFLNLIILFCIFSISIGYSASSLELSIGKIVTEVRIKKDIRVTNVIQSSSSDAQTLELNYDTDSIFGRVSLNDASSFVTYEVSVTNFGNTEESIYSILGLSDNLSYSISDYTLQDKLCDIDGKCSLGSVTKFKITIKYDTYDSNAKDHEFRLDLDFRKIHKITYEGMANNDYPKEIINGGTFKVIFTDDIPNEVAVYSDGVKVNSSEYTYSNGILELNNVSGDLVIKKLESLYNLIRLKTNGVDTNIDFAAESSSTNGDGVNIVSGTENDEYPIYYYRGAVTDNNVRFANFCWKMVRTTETGGIKLIYNGVPAADGSCDNTGEESLLSSESKFNNKANSPAYAGYMYGTIYTITGVVKVSSQSGSYVYGNSFLWDGTNYTLTDTITSLNSNWKNDRTTIATKYHYTCLNSTGVCSNVYYITSFAQTYGLSHLTLSNGKNIEDAKAEMFTNNTDSIIKTAIDTWYESNMILYTNQLEDTVWCNDRTFEFGSLKSKDTAAGTYSTEFGASGRNTKNAVYNTDDISPSLICPTIRDSFTVNSENGNGDLKYPIGLLTADEITMAGSGVRGYNNSAYLYTGEDYWTMSPYLVSDTILSWFYMFYGRYLTNSMGVMSSGVRPSISLKQGTDVFGGDGSVSNPYIVE